MANAIKLQVSGDGYRLTCGEEVSDSVAFGEPLEVELKGKRYLAFCDTADGGTEADEMEPLFEHWVYEVRPLEDVEPEDVADFDDGEEEVDVLARDGDEAA